MQNRWNVAFAVTTMLFGMPLLAQTTAGINGLILDSSGLGVLPSEITTSNRFSSSVG